MALSNYTKCLSGSIKIFVFSPAKRTVAIDFHPHIT